MPLPQHSWRISTLYQICDDDQAILDENPITTHKDWSKNCYKPIKQRIKRAYAIQQLDTCAYCRTKVEFAAYGEPVEHIVSKDPKYQWMFKPINLAVSCDGCNSNKGVKPVLRNECNHHAEPPNDTNCYKIIHPHIDIWYHHIDIEDDIFIKAIPGTKGADTIEICGLYRFNLPVKRAEELSIEQKDVYTRALHRLSDPSLPVKEREGLTEMVDELLLRLQHLNIDLN